jgi:hypothetical protein
MVWTTGVRSLAHSSSCGVFSHRGQAMVWVSGIRSLVAGVFNISEAP